MKLNFRIGLYPELASLRPGPHLLPTAPMIPFAESDPGHPESAADAIGGQKKMQTGNSVVVYRGNLP